LALTYFTWQINAFIVLYRSALTGSLYAKTLRLTSMAARELGQVRFCLLLSFSTFHPTYTDTD
jgi:hypothetical protein